MDVWRFFVFIGFVVIVGGLDMNIIDTHCHLHFSAYDADRKDVHLRMQQEGVGAITVGTAMSTSREAVAYAERRASVWATVGYHPSHVTSSYEDPQEPGVQQEPYDLKRLRELAMHPQVVAIGECGLDYHQMDPAWDSAEGRERQRQVFEDQIALAAELDKTLIVHLRDAEDDMLEVLRRARRQFPRLRIVMHAFTSTARVAQELLELDVWFGIGGIVTFKARKTTAEEDVLSHIVTQLPLDRILLETDAPWLAPVPVRGQRNEPVYVLHIARFIAQIRGMDVADFVSHTMKNARACFKCSF